MSERRVYLLCRFAEKSGIYNTWLDKISLPYEVVPYHDPDWKPPADAAMIVTHQHYRWEDLHVLRSVVTDSNVPVLVLSDGVLEYRNTWLNPGISEGSVFQPLMGHKLACLGHGQARAVESWGNLGKCEIVGMPRLDNVGPSTRIKQPSDGTFRLLIATANTPAFDDDQRGKVIESLKDIKHWLSSNTRLGDRTIEVTWRLTDGMDRELGLESADEDEDEIPVEPPRMMNVLDQVDAVITTPSTVYVEACFKELPVALLDYTNCPQYIPSAWSITASNHIEPVIAELSDPPPPRMQFQKMTLHDQLYRGEPATSRMVKLVETMLECGEESRRTGQPLQFPERILDDPRWGFQSLNGQFELAELFPENSAFQKTDLNQLQTELSAAIARLDSLPLELIEKKKFINELKSAITKLQERSVRRNQRIRDMRKTIRRMMAHIDTIEGKKS